eukprot:NODE_15_length_50561_cov_0.608081.p8 type:complete len:477 gc:universal NODE_15_length_50561_cov_0.608081:428-1858(+)
MQVAAEFLVDPENLNIYNDNVVVNCVGTGCGATSKKELSYFFKTTNFGQDFGNLEKVQEIKHLETQSLILNETVYKIPIKETEPNRFQWLLTGLRLINPGEEKIVYLAIVTIIEFSDAIDKVRIYWDQASLLKQIGFLHHIQAKPNTFQTAPNFQTPILGSSQAEKLIENKGFNTFIESIVDAQGKGQNYKQPTSIGTCLDDSDLQPIFETGKAASHKSSIGGNEMRSALKESEVSENRSIRQLKESPYKQKDYMKAYFEGTDKTDWLPKTKMMAEPEKSKVFDDEPVPAFSHKQINPNKNASHFSLTENEYESSHNQATLNKANSGRSQIFDQADEFKPSTRVLNPGCTGGKSQIQFGLDDGRPGKHVNPEKNQSHFSISGDFSDKSASFRELGLAGIKSSKGNESHFAISDAGRTDQPAPSHHGRRLVYFIHLVQVKSIQLQSRRCRSTCERFREIKSKTLFESYECTRRAFIA